MSGPQTKYEEDVVNSLLDAYEGKESSANASTETDQTIDESSTTFDFDEEFQQQILALMLRDKTFLKRCNHLIRPDYFELLTDKLIAKLIGEHFTKYKASLSDITTLKQVLAQALKDKRLKESERPDVVARIKTLYSTSIDNPDFTAETVATFAKNKAIENAMMDSVDLFEKGKFAEMETMLQKAFKVGQMLAGEAYDYFAENDNRADFRDKVAKGLIKKRGLPIGVPQFDNLLHHKGFGIGELTVFMAAAKRGKTMAIWDIGKRWALMGKNVLGITLEVSKNILGDRLDANISGVPMNKLEKHITDVKSKVQLAEMRAGKFLIHEFPTNSLRPMDVDMLIEDYRSQGIVFDAVVVDYLDIMAPNRWMPNDIANSKSVWEDMRGLAQKYDVAMLSATQTNREGAKKTTVEDTDVAEDYNKIRIADLAMSINADDDELNRGEARIYFAASRNQRGKFSVVIKNNMECMQFLTGVLEIN